MTWMLRLLMAVLPVAGWADMPRLDDRTLVGGFRLEVEMTDGLGLARPEAGIGFIGAGGAQTMIPVILHDTDRSGATTTYRFRIPQEAWRKAAAFRTLHEVPAFAPAIPFCRNPGAGRQERIAYRLRHPGRGLTPMQMIPATRMPALVARMPRCPTR